MKYLLWPIAVVCYISVLLHSEEQDVWVIFWCVVKTLACVFGIVMFFVLLATKPLIYCIAWLWCVVAAILYASAKFNYWTDKVE